MEYWTQVHHTPSVDMQRLMILVTRKKMESCHRPSVSFLGSIPSLSPAPFLFGIVIIFIIIFIIIKIIIIIILIIILVDVVIVIVLHLLLMIVIIMRMIVCLLRFLFL